MLQQMAAVAELEAGLISSRTKAALKAAKARGKKLGGFRGHAVDDAARSASLAVRRSAATARGFRLAPVIAELRASASLRPFVELQAAFGRGASLRHAAAHRGPLVKLLSILREAKRQVIFRE